MLKRFLSTCRRALPMMMIFIGSACGMAQIVQTSGLVNTTPLPLVITNRSSNGLPFRIISGTPGISAFEIGMSGHAWLLGPVAVGSGIGTAPLETMRIGSIAPQSGRGLTITLDATTSSTGLLVRDVGPTGSTDAGIVVTSQSNGVGTGLRLGGPAASGRPTLGTGIDITGGTGLRYNALTAGSGVAIDIGGTTPPRRGIEVVAGGPQHAGIVARAFSNGMGILGVSQSGAYESLPIVERVGVRGHAASNSVLASDTLVGVMGSVQRAGGGGSQTVSIAVQGKGESSATNNAGTTIGVHGIASTQAAGIAVAVGGAFQADTGQISLMAISGDVILGGEKPLLPPAFQVSTYRDMITRNRTYVHHLFASGTTRLSSLALPSWPTIDVPPTGDFKIIVPNAMIIRLKGHVNGSPVTGLRTDMPNRLVILVVTGGVIELVDEHPLADPTERMHFKDDVNLFLEQDDMIQLWYDEEIQRWRCYSF
ncbi:MAG: hypothetical protein FGM33_08340 [Candidatus Kapabacteria bacterium]|nr:hypothetical protein [Candidatus Kapabacteria bacterium]